MKASTVIVTLIVLGVVGLYLFYDYEVNGGNEAISGLQDLADRYGVECRIVDIDINGDHELTVPNAGILVIRETNMVYNIVVQEELLYDKIFNSSMPARYKSRLSMAPIEISVNDITVSIIASN